MPGLGMSEPDETAAAIDLRFEGRFGIERGDGVPVLGGDDEGNGRGGFERHTEVTGSPEGAAGFITALGISLVKNFAERTAVVDEAGGLPIDEETEAGIVFAGMNFETFTPGADFVSRRRRGADVSFERSKVVEGT